MPRSSGRFRLVLPCGRFLPERRESPAIAETADPRRQIAGSGVWFFRAGTKGHGTSVAQRLARSCWVALAANRAAAQPADDSAAENQCILCHANPDVWEKETLHLFVTPKDLADDIHWQKGLKCQDCHGGNPDTTNLREAHAIEDGFRVIESPKDIPDFCGHCHADAEYMQRYQPAAKTDQAARFWNSVHGRHLKEVGGKEAASCIVVSSAPPDAGRHRSALLGASVAVSGNLRRVPQGSADGLAQGGSSRGG